VDTTVDHCPIDVDHPPPAVDSRPASVENRGSSVDEADDPNHHMLRATPERDHNILCFTLDVPSHPS
jgi:hypothetical protein